MKETLKDIEQDILDTLECPLKDAATNLVFGKGNPNADILFIGEAPGAKEDEQGEPFVGAAGKQLDKLLASIDMTLADCYIANILKYRPPANRDPTIDEIKRHTPYLVRQIKAINPKVILTLGRFSTNFVLAGFSVAGMKLVPQISTIHGKVHTVNVDGTTYTVVPLYHPAACLYNPKLREVIVEDFYTIKSLLQT